MDAVDEALNRLTTIQNNLRVNSKIDDIFDITFIYSTLERYAGVPHAEVVLQCLSIIQQCIAAMKSNYNDIFESQMPLIVRGVAICLDIDGISHTAETLLYDICHEEKFANIVQNQLKKNEADQCSASLKSTYERILGAIRSSRKNKFRLQSVENPRLGELTQGCSSRDLTALERFDSGNSSYSTDTTTTGSPGVLDIAFIPQSMSEEWLLARSNDEVATVLEEVALVYSSISLSDRLRYSKDVSKVVRQTLQSLKSDNLAVTINGLRLLEMLGEDHATEFVPDLSMLFPVIQRYMDDPRIAIRHHALRLGGTLVIRIPFSTSGRFVFAAIEYKPQHPEISLKCAALALLSVQPAHSSSFYPLISRMILIAGEYLDVDDEKTASEELVTPRAQAAVEAAKDLTAVAIMLICASSGTDSVEARLPLKLSSILGNTTSSHVSSDICSRAMQSNFPSLETDAKLSSLSSLAMELSLRQDNAPLSARRRVTITRELSGPCPPSPPSSPHILPENCSTATTSCALEHSAEQSARKPTVRSTLKPAISIQIPSSPAVSASRLKESSQDTPMTMAYPVDEGSYMPSWTPSADEDGYSSLASPWAIRQDTPTAEMDRTKLRAIKRGGRKPGSRLRARTADESTSQSEEWDKGSKAGIPSTAGGRLMGGVDSTDVNDVMGPNEANIELGPKTPSELGIYSNDTSKREHRLDQTRTRAVLPPKTFSHGTRRRSRTDGFDEVVFGAANRGINPMDSMQCSHDENDEDADIAKAMGASDSVTSVKFDISGGRSKASLVDSYDAIPVKAVKMHSARPQQHAAAGTFHIKGNSVFGSGNGGADSSDDLGPPTLAPGPRHPRRQASSTSLAQSDQSNSSHQTECGNDELEQTGSGPPAAVPQDAFEYLATEDLQPCARPNKDISQVVTGLFQSDWPQIFYTLNTVRQLAVHHQRELTKSGQLHQIVLGVNKQVENLRSAAAKNAILALGDLFYGLKQDMDSEVPASSVVLIKRISDSSVFISETVDIALCRMITYVSPTRTLSALLAGVDNRSAPIRGQCVRMLLLLFTDRNCDLAGPRDTEMMLGKLRKILADTSPESRTFGREIVRLLINKRLVTRQAMEEVITAEGLEKAMRQVGSHLQNRYVSTRSPAHRSASPSSARYASPKTTRISPVPSFDICGTANDGESRPGRRQRDELMVSGISPRSNSDGIAMHKAGGTAMPTKQQEQFPQLLALNGLFMSLNSKNWQERRDSLMTLTDTMIENERLFTAANKMEKCVESILEKFEDGSVKVGMHAVSCARRVHTAFPDLIPGMLLTALTFILGAASSANKSINSEGNHLLHAVLVANTVDSALAQQLVGIALHDKERLRAAAFRAMTSFVNIRAGDRQKSCELLGIMRRNFFPVICQTLCGSNSKPEVKTSAADTLRALHGASNDNIETWTESPQYKDEIRRLLV